MDNRCGKPLALAFNSWNNAIMSSHEYHHLSIYSNDDLILYSLECLLFKPLWADNRVSSACSS